MAEFHHTQGAQDNVFDVEAERLARVYAEAGLGAAGGLEQQQSLVEELHSLVRDVLAANPRLEEIFRSELIAEEDKLGIIDRIFGGKAGNTTVTLLKVMARHKRLGLIRDVARVAEKLWQSRAGRVPVQLETANELDPALEREILSAFAHVLRADPIVTHRTNPDLIAGFVLRVGDRVYDCSIRTRLERMRHGMIDRAVEAIQHAPERFMSNSEA
ncbi:MAG TPA: ATP synthase F1 subunit delta [Lacipirellula sp.]